MRSRDSFERRIMLGWLRLTMDRGIAAGAFERLGENDQLDVSHVMAFCFGGAAELEVHEHEEETQRRVYRKVQQGHRPATRRAGSKKQRARRR